MGVKMKKGVQMFTVRDHLCGREEVLATLKKIKSIGYEVIQGGIPDGMPVEEYKNICIDIGLENCSVDGDYEEMLENKEELKRIVSVAETFGLTDIAIGTLPTSLRESKEGYYHFAEGINNIAKELRKEGKRLLYHPHALEFFSLGGGLKGMDIILAETDPDGLHFSLDTHWLASAGVSVTDWIRKVAGRMSIMHFKEYAIVGGAQTVETVCRDFAEVGEGNIEWNAVIEACREIGVVYALVEQDKCLGNPFDSLQISFHNMIKFQV